MINLLNFTNTKIISTKLLVVLVVPSLILVMFSVLPLRAEAQEASLFLSPGSGSFKLGEVFSVEVKVETTDQPINAAQTTVYFPPDKLEVLNISKANSIFVLWPDEPTFFNFSGKISFSGGIPHPGFKGIGNIITISFKSKNEGLALLTLGEGRILADDGKGTDILVFIKEAKYSIQKIEVPPEIKPEIPPTKVPSSPIISSLTHSNEEEWYNNNNPQFQWELGLDITGVSFVFDHQPDTIPDINSEGRIDSKIYEGIDDGIWYFHLRLANEKGWSETSHRKIQIDTRSPYPFKITIDNAQDPTNPSPDLYFETKDNTSGINHYKLKIGTSDFWNLMLAQVNPFPVPFQQPGRYPVIVRAVDEAGNIVEAKTVLEVESIENPQITLGSKIYIAGEETFYLEGIAPPGVEILISLRKDEKEVKSWSALSNNQGEWSFSTKELIKSGSYYLSAIAKDKRGVESVPSDSYKIEVSLSGISFGPFIIAFKTLVPFLIFILFFGIILAVYFTFRTRLTKKTLRRETQEAKESLRQAFETLGTEIEDRIRMLDSRPGLSEREKKACDELRKILKLTEEQVRKEIEDIEKEIE